MLRKRKFQPVLGLIVLLLAFSSCQDEWGTESPNAGLTIPHEYSISLDTVIGQLGSPTYSFTFRNESKDATLYQSIRLQKGDSSAFALNVDGYSGSEARNVRVRGKDSLYLFLRCRAIAHIHRTHVRDTLILNKDGNETKIPVRAYIEQVTEVKDRWYMDAQTQFGHSTSYLVYKGFEIPKGQIVQIPSDTRFYFANNDSTCLIQGKMIAEGTVDKPIVFAGYRSDAYYGKRPGQWMGLRFDHSDSGNILRHVHIRNAASGCLVQQAELSLYSCVLSYCTSSLRSESSSLTLSNCLLHNALMKGIELRGSHFRMIHSSLCGGLNRGGVLMSVLTDTASRLEVCNSIIFGSYANEIRFQNNQTSLIQASFLHNILTLDSYNRETYASFWPLDKNWSIDPGFTDPVHDKYSLSPQSAARNKACSASEAGYDDEAFTQDMLGIARTYPSHLGPLVNP